MITYIYNIIIIIILIIIIVITIINIYIYISIYLSCLSKEILPTEPGEVTTMAEMPDSFAT